MGQGDSARDFGTNECMKNAGILDPKSTKSECKITNTFFTQVSTGFYRLPILLFTSKGYTCSRGKHKTKKWRKSKMKRMITGLLVLCMVLTMFLGCAAQAQVPETTARRSCTCNCPDRGGAGSMIFRPGERSLIAMAEGGSCFLRD